MAKSPVGYRSPFNKISSVKSSPAKFTWLPWMTQAAVAAAPGIIKGVGSLFGRKKRRQEQRESRQNLEQAKQAFESIEYKNPYENLTNPYADLTNPYANMENVYEDATVDTRAADYLKEQQQQSRLELLD